jgi:hypothetical protein
MTYLISILVPTLIERRQKFNFMIEKLYRQIETHNLQDKIEIISICDDRSIPLSVKRNRMQDMSSGTYFTHLDDDDNFTDNYCKSVIDHIENNLTDLVDVITYDQLCFVQNSKFIVKQKIDHPMNLVRVGNHQNLPVFNRYPWQYCLWNSKKYKKVWRTDSDTNAREDQNWLNRIQLEYPESQSNIDFIGHEYHYEDPSQTTCQ